MKLRKQGAHFFIPDGKDLDGALERTTHMAISAHQDDIEIMAYHGILECFGRDDKWFLGCVAADGAGSPRDGLYKDYSDEEMMEIRIKEQKKAAYVGEYGALALLNYKSSEIKDGANDGVTDEIYELISRTRPEVIYTHNLADKHDTHVAVAIKVIRAIRRMPRGERPLKLYGCEVWRGLDWINDNEKVSFDVAAHPNIAAALVEVYDSQICGGKRYDLATAGRRLANATYAESHGTDLTQAQTYAMDLTPLIEKDDLDILEYTTSHIDRFKDDVASKIKKAL